MRPYTVNLNWTNGYELFKMQIFNFLWKFDMMNPSLSNSMPMDQLNATEDSSLCNSTPMNLLNARDRLCLEREKRVTARLQCRHKRDQEWRRSEQTEVRQAKLDRQHVRRAAEQPAAMQTRLATDHTSTSRWNTAYQSGWHISITCLYLHTFLTL